MQKILQAISIDQIRNHIQALQGVRHPVTAPDALDRAADYIRDSLGASGCETSEHRFTEDDHQYRNILGLKRGTRYPERHLLVLAHYDSEQATPGANDNASGVAAVLELARVFISQTFESSILFVGVSLEEMKWDVNPEDAHLDKSSMAIARGSQALAAYASASAWDILGVINFEEIAYAGDSVAQTTLPGLPVSVPENGNFIGLIGNANSASLVESCARSIERYALPLPYVPLVVPGNGEAFPDTRRSDHAPFWDLGFKAIVLTDTANFRTPHYHQASDTLETLNLDFAAEVCRAAAGMVIEIAGLEDTAAGPVQLPTPDNFVR